MDTLSHTFAALSDPTRRAILERLKLGPSDVRSLATPFDISAPAISRHLKVLEKADLITRERQAQTLYCHLNASALKGAAGWLEEYARFWNASFDRLAALLENQEDKQPENDKTRRAK